MRLLNYVELLIQLWDCKAVRSANPEQQRKQELTMSRIQVHGRRSFYDYDFMKFSAPVCLVTAA